MGCGCGLCCGSQGLLVAGWSEAFLDQAVSLGVLVGNLAVPHPGGSTAGFHGGCARGGEIGFRCLRARASVFFLILSSRGRIQRLASVKGIHIERETVTFGSRSLSNQRELELTEFL